MSLFSIPTKKHTAFYDSLYSSGSRTPTSVNRINRNATDMSKNNLTLRNSKSDDTTRSLDKSKEINRTYVVSGLSKSAGLQIRGGGTPASGRLTLQRRKTGAENAEKTMNENTQNSTPAPEKRLTLQRRTRTGSIVQSEDKDIRADSERQRLVSGPVTQMPKILSESNYGTSGGTGVLRSASLRDNATKTKSKEFATPVNTPGKGVERPTRFAQKQPLMGGRPLSDFAKSEEPRATTSTPTKKTQFEKLATKKEVFEKLAGRTVPKAVAVKSLSLERPKTHAQLNPEDRKHIAAPGANKFSAGALTANVTTNVPPAQVRKNATPVGADHNEDAKEANGPTLALAPTPVLIEALVRPSTVLKQQESLKMENSAVTVAVRVRPFNAREKTEKAFRVIYMNGQETVVKHPDYKQSHSFTYDYSFCSVDQQEADFAGQQTVYEKLAKPLLERALEGFNTCLFAYGQTGSGKSYTMMGFGEETGVIPRFCEELFSRLSSIEDQEVSCHLEMSYFEVYNEKIHDLLVARDTPNQKSLPLRVREHPVHGPYVAELSTNVVTSYKDIQGWLELGNQQRATAATGMNDKSSRSHSVFTLVMTQTTTEFVEEEEHDHRITSRINLVDLAGSERCSSAQTSGDRLREGASINKSLLTLGKVISALSEQAQTSRKVFTPYRESVLTWLLKESLGGNSKTAMIATVSPAGSNVEESLSTLRYARQARMIINLAKVNEDTNAKLIRELKAEVEKLRAAQMSSRGVEPEKMRLFQQEIAALRGQLSQQEREMAEAHRAWREKLEQAEKRKRGENKELQRAGGTFKVDNRLPNLVNLNEDPQLSEMLLYMIHEGQTRVGQHKSESAHDIQLSGALIAVHHCVISNVNGTVSLTPMENAKTFVNGKLIAETTVLHHGDRVILGGDHYFRFNHPAEVQSGKRASCWTGAGDGQKDFEFAKNELLLAQRAQLEAEIQEARVKAKEEMMQGIQMAKELAQKEMSEQRATYEDRIVTLERELEEENERKRCQEQHQQEVVSQMAELQSAKSQLEQEVDAHKKRLRLHLEAQTARQAMEDHSVRQAKIVAALEAEKKKINRDLEEMQKKVALRGNHTPKSVPPQWDAMKLSFMIEEANKISAKLRKHTVFSRHEGSEKENPGLQVQVHNTKMGISTFWSLEKFQSSLAAMRELDQEEQGSKDDDVFYDPNDEWEQDLSVTSSSSNTSSFSRRRSRSLLKSKRISGRLYEIRVHPIQSLLGNTSSSSQSGLMGVGKPPSTNSASPDSALPGICKDLIGKTLIQLSRYSGSEADEGESLADRLTSDLGCVYTAVRTISGLYEGLDDDSQEKVFVCNLEAQTQLVRATSAIERAVFVTMQWVSSTSSSSRSYSGPLYTTAEELKTQVKRMGGFFQLLVQGCDSEISSMVTEAHKKSGRCLDAAVRTLCHLAALTGTPLRTTELDSEAIGKPSLAVSLLEGTNQGVRSLAGEGLTIAKEMLREAQLAYPRTPVQQSLKSKMLDLAHCLQSYIHCNLTEREENFQRNGTGGSGGGGGVGGEEEEADRLHLQRLRNTAAKQFQLNQAIRQLHGALSLALRGQGTDSSLYVCQASLSSSLEVIDDIVSGLPKETGAASLSSGPPCVQSVMVARDELQVALRSLSTLFSHQGAAEKSESLASGDSVKDDKCLSNEGSTASAPNPLRYRTVTKMVYSLSTGAVSVSKGDPHWV